MAAEKNAGVYEFTGRTTLSVGAGAGTVQAALTFADAGVTEVTFVGDPTTYTEISERSASAVYASADPFSNTLAINTVFSVAAGQTLGLFLQGGFGFTVARITFLALTIKRIS